MYPCMNDQMITTLIADRQSELRRAAARERLACAATVRPRGAPRAHLLAGLWTAALRRQPRPTS